MNSYDVPTDSDSIDYGPRAHAVLDSLQDGRNTLENIAADHGTNAASLKVAAQWCIEKGYAEDVGSRHHPLLEITAEGQNQHDEYTGPAFGEVGK